MQEGAFAQYLKMMGSALQDLDGHVIKCTHTSGF